jgi:glycosyltransferase involved in cell wall biosynthesis
MRIGIELLSALLGRRGIRRYAWHLPLALAVIDPENEYRILHVYLRGALGKFPGFDGHPNFRNVVYRIPPRLIAKMHGFFGWPGIDDLFGNVDMIHYTGMYMPTRKKVTKILTVHAVDFMYLGLNVRPDYPKIRAVFEKGMNNSDYFVTVSKTLRKNFLDAYPKINPDRVEGIPFGVSPEFRVMDKAATEKAVFAKYKVKPPFALFVGIITIDKSIELLLRSFAVFAETHKDYSLVCAGEFTVESPPFFALAKELGIGDRIVWTGYVEQGSDILPALYNAADFYAHPSVGFEGWSSPLIEAMTCGTPVVASHIPVFEEEIGNDAIMVPGKSPADFAAAYARLADNRAERDAFVKAGLARSVNFGWEMCARRTLAFYNKVYRETR